ncbi:TWiK family of potassium channels protein 18-like [Ptychodera flava]|uniref:TWiK family of potassium channels protein 18-like n=1 Tax=Ptychodera flava TaxID=63121 RepID=UPI003969D79B
MTSTTMKRGAGAEKKKGFWYRHSTFVANLTLISTLILYLTAGAFMFLYIEGNDERSTIAKANDVSKQLSEEITKQLMNTNRSEFMHVATDENFTAILRDQMRQLAVQMSSSSHNSEVGKGRTKWTYSSSLFFCMTVITTIGYGTIVPVTTAGRIVCMLYAIIGIPLLLLVLSIIGNKLADPCRVVCLLLLCRNVKRRVQAVIPMSDTNTSFGHVSSLVNSIHEVKKPHFSHFGELYFDKSTQTDESGEDNQRTRQNPGANGCDSNSSGEGATIIMVTILLLLYLAAGSLMYSFKNGWSFVDSLYFVFVTLSTIGFGDIIPKHRDDGSMQFTAALAFLYTFVGLAIMSTAFSLAQNSIRKTFNLVQNKCNG